MVRKVLEEFKEDEYFKKAIVYIKSIEEKEPLFGKLQNRLPAQLEAYLESKGIRLYKHQCEAIESVRKNRHIFINSHTASGKTLSFLLPIFERLLKDKTSCALFIYPTKALSNDQIKNIKEIEGFLKIETFSALYDGDTEPFKRKTIRERSRIIITNPYELHRILPYNSKWRNFFSNLRFVVIDEAHVYRGVFGSHMAYLLRRLRRILKSMGSEPLFILSSATIANPQEFSKKLTGLDFSVIEEDTSFSPKRYFIFYDPYLEAERNLFEEAKRLILFFIERDLQTLCFTPSRRMAEVLAMAVKKSLIGERNSAVSPYRAGYLPEERRRIEKDLKEKRLLGVVSTEALELGIDIGSLDCIIMAGYPGSVISTWQRAGRAGRRGREAIIILVSSEDLLDRYFMRNPERFFEKSPEQAFLDLSNPYILSGHILCAASEKPLEEKDLEYFEGEREKIVEALKEAFLLSRTPFGLVFSGKGRPHEALSLNNIGEHRFSIIAEEEVLETIDMNQAFREAHNGAVFFHEGKTYIVEMMDLEKKQIFVKRKDVDYYTKPLKETEIFSIREKKKREIGRFHLFFGDLSVREHYKGYRVLKANHVLSYERLSLPPLEFKTKGLWITIPFEVAKDLEDLEGGLHALEHAFIGLMPLHILCDRDDVGGISTPFHPLSQSPTIFIYDGFEGGIGLSEKAFYTFEKILIVTYEHVKNCPCEEGCPSCIYSPKCGNENRQLSKSSSLYLMEYFLREIES